jgi:hypothetical protein
MYTRRNAAVPYRNTLHRCRCRFPHAATLLQQQQITTFKTYFHEPNNKNPPMGDSRIHRILHTQNRTIGAMLALFPNGILLFPSYINVKNNTKTQAPNPNLFRAIICWKNIIYMIKFRFSSQIEIGMLTGLEAQNASTNLKVWGSNPHHQRFVRVVRYSEECPDYKNPKLQPMAKVVSCMTHERSI